MVKSLWVDAFTPKEIREIGKIVRDRAVYSERFWKIRDNVLGRRVDLKANSKKCKKIRGKVGYSGRMWQR